MICDFFSEQLTGGTQLKMKVTFSDDLERLWKPMRYDSNLPHSSQIFLFMLIYSRPPFVTQFITQILNGTTLMDRNIIAELLYNWNFCYIMSLLLSNHKIFKGN